MSRVIVRDFFVNIGNHLFSLWPILKIMKKTLFTSTTVFDKITQPTHLLWWDADEIFSPTIAQDMQKKIKGSTLTYVHGNHDWCLYMPEMFLNLIERL
jgi:pimeloyl-ACP methyl ester carboxylesterase